MAVAQPSVGGGGVVGGGGGTAAVRVVEQLRKRLEAAQAENEQLEDMLKREEQRAEREAEAARRMAAELSELQVSHRYPRLWLNGQREFSPLAIVLFAIVLLDIVLFVIEVLKGTFNLGWGLISFLWAAESLVIPSDLCPPFLGVPPGLEGRGGGSAAIPVSGAAYLDARPHIAT